MRYLKHLALSLLALLFLLGLLSPVLFMSESEKQGWALIAAGAWGWMCSNIVHRLSQWAEDKQRPLIHPQG